MNMALRRCITSIPVLRGLYRKARKTYHNRRILRAARNYCVSFDEFRKALSGEDGKLVDIETLVLFRADFIS
jgi:hypothetical protein